ncbi:Lactococcin-G-processing and transport ATP-binding protein LagD [Aliarcobacter thereius]|uniref:Lactococcin-G-processing and transport ATP-binding protein LagD n=2 Tax=Aliarcobacter thereius TaxID=544718 RepID=A0A1C0B6S2_9BACT|nr:cysteine peptidase family C39 domain-containing protein [Aliarcobacter thereius]OCL86775.1 Lactococcin-G-processing and transport ATP-binding protein LagD [Aliarcobacter thereius]OCL90977.1 Lactococcin-G-processing and transport ATP-binding protein LagD [Aliarcobacter thereius]OCL96194.1 Lactococcin-G-processing and transport ATP-binding protein LagD [Aliarcobacter thereius LMG 24486]OCL98944.1 Lactococcin-G-processing and transport ATP-binding protein LagD [Aliarcobacter thereius]QBF15840.
MAQILISLFILQISLFAEFKVKSFLEIKYNDVVKQTYEESCGASALATLFNLYGFSIDEKELIDKLETTDLVTFNDLQKLALDFEFNSKGYKISKEIFDDITVPVIARIVRKMDYPHFVVVYNLDKNSVIILDPNAGKFIISKKEFYSYWIDKESNFILVALPKDKRKEFKELDSFLVKYLF